MRFLDRLRHHVTEREFEMWPVIFATAVPKHRQQRSHRILKHRALVRHGAAERLEFRDAGTLPHAKFHAAVTQEVEHSNTLGDAGWVAGGELNDAVAEADVLGPLAGGPEKHLRRRAMRVFFEEVVLYHPSIVVAAPIGDLELCQRIVIELALSSGLPRPRQLQLVENTEFHCSPRIGPSTAAAACAYSKLPKVDKVERFFRRR